MKRYLWRLVLLAPFLFPGNLFAQDLAVQTPWGETLLLAANIQQQQIGVIVQYNAVTSGATYLFDSDFNDEPADAKWAEYSCGGTWNEDYTTAPAPVEGAHSVYYINCEYYFTWSGTASNTYIAFMYHVPAANEDGGNVLRVRQSDGTTDLFMVRLAWQGSDNLRLQLRHSCSGDCDSGYDSVTATTDLSDATTWYYKIRYLAGSGADGQIDVWYSSDGTSWNLDIDVNDATETGTAAYGLMESLGGDEPTIADDVRVDDADINY